MGDEIDTKSEGEEGNLDSPISFADLFEGDEATSIGDEISPSEDKPKEEEGKKEEEPKKEDSPTPSEASGLEDIKRENLILKTEMELIKKQLSRPATPPAKEPPTPQIDQKAEDEKFAAKLRVDPVGAIKDLISEVVKPELGKLRQDTSREAEEKVRLLDLHKRDQEETKKDYGQLMLSNPEFRAEAERIYAEVTNGEWFPGAMGLAAGKAYASLIRSGKLKPPASVIPMERAKAPIDGLLGEQTKKEDGPKDPLSEFTGPERARIQKTCKELGIKVEDYVKQYTNLKSADVGYGRR